MNKIKVNEIKPKMVIELNKKYFVVVSTSYNQNCQRAPVVGLVLADITNGNKKETTLGAHDFVFTINIREREGTFVSKNDDMYSIIDSAAYDLIEVPQSKIIRPEYFLDGCSVLIAESEDIGIVSISPVQIMTVTVRYCPDSDKEKPAEITDNLTIKVPSYIKTGEEIIINTETGEFVKRK